MDYIPAKNIVTKTKSPEQWFGVDYNMNIYRGCCHGCIYCDSRSDCYHVDNFDTVRAKENAAQIIESDLRSKRSKGVIGTGAMSDPYNPFEEEYKLTRHALELIDRYRFGAAIATKSHLVARDIDVLKRIKQNSPVIVKVTITAADDMLCKRIEPNVSESSKRFWAIKQLSYNGIFAGVLLMPVLPFIEDNEENILGIIKFAAESGARFIYPALGVTLRNNQRDHFYKCLDKKFPGMKARYIKQYGNSYWCHLPNYKALWNLIVENCEKYGMLYKMQDIIDGYKSGYDNKQLTLF